MSSRQTKFPKNRVPARSTHQATVLVGKNGLPVDALATLEPGQVLLGATVTAVTYSSPTVTVDGSVNLLPIENFSSPKHTGVLLFTDAANTEFFIDPDSISDATKSFDIYTDENFTSAPASINLAAGWFISEAALVNRLQTTTTAVVDNVEFRDVEVRLDGTIDANVQVDAADGDNVAINDAVTGSSAEVNNDRELQVRDDDANTTLTNIDNKLVDGNDIGDVTVNNPVSNPVQAQLGDGSGNISSIDVGADKMLVVKKGEDPTFYIRIDRPDANTTYVGKTYDLDAATSDAVWQITRTVTSGSETITQYADDEATYDKAWSLRTTYFGPAPFANQFSIQFDGGNDFLDIPHNAVVDFDFRTEAASWNCWIKTSDTSAAKTYMEKMDGNTGWRFYLSGNDLTIQLRGTGFIGDSIRVRTDPGDNVGDTLNDGSWHMITCTYDGSGNASGVTLYVDGSPQTLDTQNDGLSTDTSNTENMAIASRTGGGNNFGAGNIDEPSVWDVELSAANVTTIYNLGVPVDLQGYGVSPITASLNAWWRNGDGPNDDPDNLTIEDVESGLVATMTSMTPGDVEGAVPG